MGRHAILERLHQVIGNCLRTFELEERELDEENPFEPFVTATAYAIRSTYHTTLQATPGQLVFGRDMILPIQYKANWASITLRKQQLIDKSNARENRNRLQHEYAMHDKVLLKRPGILPKMSVPYAGPYTITAVHNNGTVTIQKNAKVQQLVNIRRILPYYEATT